MSLFDAPLFFRHRRRGKPWSHSSKLYLCSAVLLAAGFLSDTIFEKHLYWLMVIAVLLFFVGRITRFFEYKPLAGTFNGDFKITEDHFEIQGQVFVFPKISDFSFKVSDYYGESLDSRSFGGPYSQGVGNWIQFTESGETYKYYFQFYSDAHVDKFYESFVRLLYTEKLPFNAKYLSEMPAGFGSYGFYRVYIGKLIAENKINCTKGLLLMEYDSDAEADELRKRYCQ